MKIGLPRALLFHRYETLWVEFFTRLKHETVVSPPTSPDILAAGILHSVDESCLSAKIFMGHVHYLIGKCAYILVPRIENYGGNEKVCVKFNALCDIARNTFGARLLEYDVDAAKGKHERAGFIRMGRVLGAGKKESAAAYAAAAESLSERGRALFKEEMNKLLLPGVKIMLAGHAYNLHDAFIGAPVARALESMGASVIYADRLKSAVRASAFIEKFAPGLYWTYHKELFNAVELYRNRVDGLVFVTAFPCGPDALVHGLMLRRTNGIPVCGLTVDELQGETGLRTRIESFMDIITMRHTKCKA